MKAIIFTLCFIIFNINIFASVESEVEDKRFHHKNDTLSDTFLNIIWQNNKDIINLEFTWEEANKYCSNLILNNIENWRLPTYNELESIHYYRLQEKKLIKHSYWSSSKGINNWHKTRIIVDRYYNHGFGGKGYSTKSAKYNVQCISRDTNNIIKSVTIRNVLKSKKELFYKKYFISPNSFKENFITFINNIQEKNTTIEVDKKIILMIKKYFDYKLMTKRIIGKESQKRWNKLKEKQKQEIYNILLSSIKYFIYNDIVNKKFIFKINKTYDIEDENYLYTKNNVGLIKYSYYGLYENKQSKWLIHDINKYNIDFTYEARRSIELKVIVNKISIKQAFEKFYEKIKQFYKNELAMLASKNKELKSSSNTIKEIKLSKNILKQQDGKKNIKQAENNYKQVNKTTLSDSKNNLEWQDNEDIKTNKRNWNNAIKYCKNLNLDNKVNWRIPTNDELFIAYKNKLNFSNKITKKYMNVFWSSDIYNKTWKTNLPASVKSLFGIGSSSVWTTDLDTCKQIAYSSLAEISIRCVRNIKSSK
jgi:hypothetical protein